MENNEEIQEQDLLEENESGSIKQWFQDNLRIIISAFIVVVIAAGIYSYSSRTEDAEIPSEENGGLLSEISQEDQKMSKEEPAKETSEEKTAEMPSGEQKDQKIETEKKSEIVSESQETETSFVEKAIPGDGTTRMARRALANYLEKNTDSSLTAEHKIYIEDYMRKNISQKRVSIGDSVEFEKSLIQEAISNSKNLNENQLKNLHKYAVRVPSLM